MYIKYYNFVGLIIEEESYLVRVYSYIFLFIVVIFVMYI